MADQGPTYWKLSGFLEHFRFVHNSMRDHAYAWVLGAGASKTSGIPLAGELVQRWLGELHRRLDDGRQPLARWSTAENLGIPGFKYEQSASFYSRVYERRFCDNPDEGFAYLEDLMSSKDPSPGYSILAQVLEKSQHKVIISTNFDNLVADALSIYTSTFPLVIGHESLANFVRVVSRRPVICKIHRDLLLGPKNDTRSLRRLHESWAAALRALFSQYTPLFIGYGGNDDSLMDLLESLDPGDIKGQMVWCYYERSEPSERIRALVQQHRGALVPVPDFDLLMVLLGAQMGIEPIDAAIEERAKKRAQQYRKQLIALDTTAYPDVRRVLRGAFERAGGTLAWQEKAQSEPSTDRREQIFGHALQEYPNSLELKLEFARFKQAHYRDLAGARQLLEECRQAEGAERDAAKISLARLNRSEGKLSEADVVLQTVSPEWQTSEWIVEYALVRECHGDFSGAETVLQSAFQTTPTGYVEFGLFCLRRGLKDEARLWLDIAYNFSNADVSAVYGMGVVLWLVVGDIEGARRKFNELIDLKSAANTVLVVAAAFFLAQREMDDFEATMQLMALKPMDGWHAEAEVVFLRLVSDVLASGDGARHLAFLKTHLSREYHHEIGEMSILPKVIEQLDKQIPNYHRKFLAALAQAIYDPALKSGLLPFPQWKASSESTAVS